MGFENVDYVEHAQNAGESAIGQYRYPRNTTPVDQDRCRERSRPHNEHARPSDPVQNAGESVIYLKIEMACGFRLAESLPVP